ncbi:ImmA/IrrE family metallo-endopeptidase [Sphingobium yanoikuyae]|uniref:ImmA/IrrE family metallo-endopeptidase n=1 Tax=Sphingobium yanoikuyae TaxID=13690 RepID=A0A6M4G4E4_SPHYA|nr:ImmA/IrrE family metallo-endopeptidase [Sphingobium yanoikuyae]QJR01133.1 ImmA/IrrE family metallo-endopeptidase [Sphingobium yanoikuyae]
MDKIGSVQRRSEHQIERLAKMVRQELGVDPGSRLAMQPILEFALDDMIDGAYLRVASDGEMGGAEGRTDWHQPVITLSAGTYAALTKGNHRARMTAAHELGHLLMHTKQPVYYYRERTKDNRLDPEWQADTFAAALLMPADAFRKMKSVRQAMTAFGISRSAALRRARGLKMSIADDLVRRKSGGHKRKGSSSMNPTP